MTIDSPLQSTIERIRAKSIADGSLFTMSPNKLDRSKETVLPPDLEYSEAEEILEDMSPDIMEDYAAATQQEKKLFPRPMSRASIVARLRDYLGRHPEDVNLIVKALVKQGKVGNVIALKELIDRVDGKVAERHKVEGELPIKIIFVPAQQLLSDKDESHQDEPESPSSPENVSDIIEGEIVT